jgi:hypothetical protein
MTGQQLLRHPMGLFFGVDEENPSLVSINIHRKAVAGEGLPQCFKISHKAFVFVQIQAGDAPGGIVNKAVQGLPFPGSEPVERRRVCLQEFSEPARLFRRENRFPPPR